MTSIPALHATQHLINLGCKKIALFSAIDNLSVGKLRAEGYFKALENNNLKPDESLIVRTDTAQDFEAKATKIIRKPPNGRDFRSRRAHISRGNENGTQKQL